MSAEVKATVVADIDELRGLRVPGAIDFVGEPPAGVRFICPCGCGNESWMAFSERDSPGPAWDWNGSREHPTLTPSVFNSGMPCQWHGYLTDGVWRSC